MSLEDTALFVQAVRAFAVNAGWTLSHAAAYVARHLDSARKRDLATELELTTPRQLSAEDAAYRLVERALYPARRGRQLRRADCVRRATDWPSTALLRASSADLGFVEVETTSIPDRGALGALAELTGRWIALLRTVDDAVPTAAARASRLERALASLRRHSGLVGERWSDTVARRWARVSPEDAALVNAAARRTVQPMSDADAAALARVLARDSSVNENALLEATAGITIALAAARTPGWKVERDARHGTGAKEPEIRLGGHGLQFRVLKGRPKDPDGKESMASYRSAIVSSLDLSSHGGQPDHILTFWSQRDPKRFVTVLADAKRNTSGKSYLSASVNRMLAYCVEYAKWLRFSVSETGAPTAAILPAATLFAWDLDDNKKAPGGALQLMHAFDRADIAATAIGPSRVTAWFATMATQALEQLLA
jgi:hypothetical protein